MRRIAGSIDLERAKEEIRSRYFFVGLTDRYTESLQIFKCLCPYAVDLRHSPRRVAADNTVKNELLGNPATRKLLEEANTVDQALYEYVRDFIYPAQLAKAGLAQGEPPDPPGPAPRRYTLRYGASRVYGNVVYKSTLKLRKRLRPA